VTASRVEDGLDVDASQVLTDSQKARVRARHGPRVVAVAQDARSQARNRELALKRLRERVERALHVPKHRRPTKRTKASQVRRLDSKRRQGERKRDRRRPEMGE
jgi:ribosome-associated protein